MINNIKNELKENKSKFNITYAIVEEKYTLGESSRTSYGIVAYCDADITETASIIASVHDITSDKGRLLNLIDACNRLELSIIHLSDVIDDFWTESLT